MAQECIVEEAKIKKQVINIQKKRGIESIVQNELNILQKNIEDVTDLNKAGGFKMNLSIKKMNDNDLLEMKNAAFVDYHNYMQNP